MKAVQHFTKEYLENCRKFSIEETVRFLEEFRELHAKSYEGKTKLISLRVDEGLLDLLKLKATQEGTKYQTKIKDLIKEYVFGEEEGEH